MEKQLAHGHTEGLWMVLMHLPHSICLAVLARLGSGSPIRQGYSDLQLHVSPTHSVSCPTHGAAAKTRVPWALLFLRSTKENSTHE